jgi:hypothetical protein
MDPQAKCVNLLAQWEREGPAKREGEGELVFG